MNPLAKKTILSSRKDALCIFQAGIIAADPYEAVKQCLFSEEDHLKILVDLSHKTSLCYGQSSASDYPHLFTD